jgi:hypothetical protein
MEFEDYDGIEVADNIAEASDIEPAGGGPST